MMLIDEFFLGTQLYHQKFTEWCKPISNFLGVTYAIYVNIDIHGKMFSVCTSVPWIERFLEEHYYRLDPLMVHPDNIHNGFAFDTGSEDQEFKDTLLYDAVVKFNWCNSFAYIEKTPTGGYFGFDFGTTKDNHQMINKLINSTLLLKNFIRKLHETVLSNTKDLQEKKMDFAALKREIFHTQQGLIFNNPTES